MDVVRRSSVSDRKLLSHCARQLLASIAGKQRTSSRQLQTFRDTQQRLRRPYTGASHIHRRSFYLRQFWKPKPPTGAHFTANAAILENRACYFREVKDGKGWNDGSVRVRARAFHYLRQVMGFACLPASEITGTVMDFKEIFGVRKC